MVSKFTLASIVLLAEAHNPSILSPDWLKRNQVIIENPVQFVLTPDFAIFESKKYNLIVDRQRLQLIAKKPTKQNANSIMEIIIKYVEILSHIPYLRLGFNFEWLAEENETSMPPEIKLSLGTITDMSPLIPDHELCYGSIISAKAKDYQLRLSIIPTNEDAVTYRFNFDYTIKDTEVEKIVEFFRSYTEKYEFASSIVKKTIEKKGVE